MTLGRRTLGVACNPYAMNVPAQLIETAARLDVPVRLIDLPTLTVDIHSDGQAAAADSRGAIDIDSLAPYLLYGYPAAVHAFRVLLRQAYTQNPVDGVTIADDKASTAERLSAASVAQVPTKICSLDLQQALSRAADIGYPVILKRTHGAQGRWVRRAHNPSRLPQAFHELESEGRGALILQPEVGECPGRSIRAVITGGQLLAAAERTAAGNEWRSNIAGGAQQRPINLAPEEKALAEDAARALGLRHAGVDLLRTLQGPLVLEVNSCPDFTSMLPYFDKDLTLAVLSASLR
ncbi:MAG: ATP-grasp domain-containing protein [Pseudonocardiaceae bacterium]